MRIEQQTPTAPLGLQDFIDRVTEQLVPTDPESIWSFRADLAALALNKDWIFDLMVQSVEARQAHTLNGYQPSYFIAHRGKNFTLRASLWLPERKNSTVAQLENAAYSYDYPHDHNFDILSVTCLGGGYQTDAYKHLRPPHDLETGEEIDVEFLGRIHQAPLTCIMYEKFVDIHTQLPPDDVVMTLNLLPHAPADFPKSQHLFESVTRTRLRVLGRPSSPEGRALSAVRILGKVHSLLSDEPARPEDFFLPLVRQARSPALAKAAGEMFDALQAGAGSVNDRIKDDLQSKAAVLKYFEVAERAREWREDA